jgi:hypothetical protein
MVDLGNLFRGAAGLALVALRSFVATVVVVGLAGIVLAAVSGYLLRDQPLYAWVAAVVALAESLAAGVVLGVKRGVILALVHGVRSLQLGRSAVRLVFERLLRVSAAEEVGERGGSLVRVVERIPLAQAERNLAGVVDRIVREEEGGWLRRRAQEKLLSAVQYYTLARFRQESARHGGVDLVLVQAEVKGTIDDRLVRRLRAGLNVWTLLVVCALPAAVLAQTYIVIALLNTK